jgi:glutathione S-transferase
LSSEPQSFLKATSPGPRNACLSWDRVRDRLGQLSRRLGDADWLDGAFSAGDLMMASVLIRLKASGILGEYPNLAAYVARGEARPAYKRAFDAQLALNTGKPPTG